MPLLLDEFTPYPETPAERARRLFQQPSTSRAVPRSQLPAWVQRKLQEQEEPKGLTTGLLGPEADPRLRAERLRELIERPLHGTAPGIASTYRPPTREVSAPGSYDADPYFDDTVRQDELTSTFRRPSTYQAQRAEERLWEPVLEPDSGQAGAYSNYVRDQQMWHAGIGPDVAASVNSLSAYTAGMERLRAPRQGSAANWVPERLVDVYRAADFTDDDLIYVDRFSPSMKQRAALIAELESSGDGRDAQRAVLLRGGAPIDDPFAWVDRATSPVQTAAGWAGNQFERGVEQADRGVDRARSEIDERVDRLSGVADFVKWFGGVENTPLRLEELRRELEAVGLEFSDEFIEFGEFLDDPDIRRRLRNGIVAFITTNPIGSETAIERFWQGVTLERNFLGEDNPIREVTPGPLEDPAVWAIEWLADPVTLAEIAVGLIAPWSAPYRWGPVLSDFAFDAIDELTE